MLYLGGIRALTAFLAGREQLGSPGIACAVRGWKSLRPVSVRLPSGTATALRESVLRNIAALILRCEQLYRHHSVLPTEKQVASDLAGPLDWCEKGAYFYQPEVFFTQDRWNRAGGYLKSHLYWAMLACMERMTGMA